MAKPYLVEDVDIPFKNFTGAPTRLNPKGGTRDFAVGLSREDADRLLEAGFKVKHRPETDEYPESFILNVKINLEARYPPHIYLLKDGAKIPLDDDTIRILDLMTITYADVAFNPYTTESGTTAYLTELYVRVEDGLASKYAEIPTVSM